MKRTVAVRAADSNRQARDRLPRAVPPGALAVWDASRALPRCTGTFPASGVTVMAPPRHSLRLCTPSRLARSVRSGCVRWRDSNPHLSPSKVMLYPLSYSAFLAVSAAPSCGRLARVPVRSGPRTPSRWTTRLGTLLRARADSASACRLLTGRAPPLGPPLAPRANTDRVPRCGLAVTGFTRLTRHRDYFVRGIVTPWTVREIEPAFPPDWIGQHLDGHLLDSPCTSYEGDQQHPATCLDPISPIS